LRLTQTTSGPSHLETHCYARNGLNAVVGRKVSMMFALSVQTVMRVRASLVSSLRWVEDSSST
jgi:hypothetical protein